MGLFPLAFYLFFYCVLTYPAILFFNTHFFADCWDGMGNAYGLWWINQALTQLHQSPWHTTLLHFPYGISLRGTPSPLFNGLLAIPLLKFLTLAQTYNVLLLFGFVMGGLTAFWLAHAVTKSYWPSLIGGYIFTFSNYHFAHSVGHLNLVSIEWIPLFILCWIMLLTKPRVLWGLGAAILLTATFLCDFYYFFVCCLSACLIAGWYAFQRRDAFFLFRKEFLAPLLAFGGVALAAMGPPLFAMIQENIRDPFVADCCGKIPCCVTRRYGMDLLSPFIYGAHWRFGQWTAPFWSKLGSYPVENSVHLGLSVIFVAVTVWIQRRENPVKDLGLWYLLAIFLAVLAMGPVLNVAGWEFSNLSLPYAWLQVVCPPLKMARIPLRLIIITILAMSVISAIGFKTLLDGPRKKQWLAAGLLILLFFETLPRVLVTPNFTLCIPAYVQALKRLPGKEAVIDMVTSHGLVQYYQTIHERPLAFGYIARYPTSIYKKDQELQKAITERNFSSLRRDYQFRYLVTGDDFPPPHPAVVFRDGDIKIYDLATQDQR